MHGIRGADYRRQLIIGETASSCMDEQVEEELRSWQRMRREKEPRRMKHLRF
jgi:hypothetical protein